MNLKSAIASLRAEIKELTEKQKVIKAELRKPHDSLARPAGYYQYDAYIQATKISGYLNLLSILRGKPCCHVAKNAYARGHANSYMETKQKWLEENYPDESAEPAKPSRFSKIIGRTASRTA